MMPRELSLPSFFAREFVPRSRNREKKTFAHGNRTWPKVFFFFVDRSKRSVTHSPLNAARTVTRAARIRRSKLPTEHCRPARLVQCCVWVFHRRLGLEGWPTAIKQSWLFLLLLSSCFFYCCCLSFGFGGFLRG